MGPIWPGLVGISVFYEHFTYHIYFVYEQVMLQCNMPSCLQLKLANVNLEYNFYLLNDVSLTYKVTHQGYSVGLCCNATVALRFLTRKTMETKKVHRCSMSTTTDRN